MKDPEHPEAILVELKPQRSSRYWNVLPDLARSAVEFVQVPTSRNPELPFFILAAQFDIVATQTQRIIRFMRIVSDRSGRRIQTVQAAGSCQPQYSGAVLTDVIDERNRVVCKRLGRAVEFIEKLIAS